MMFADLTAYCLQLACLIALGVCVPPLCCLTAARVRYGYCRVLLLLCLLLPWLQVRPAVAVDASDVSPVFASVAAVLPDAATSAVSASSDFNWTAALVVLFLAGVVLRGAWLVWGLFRLRELRRIAVESPSFEDVHDLQRVFGASADLRCVAGIGQPVTFGFLRPFILLPPSLHEKPEHVQRAVLAHELIHVRQHDWAWLLAEEAIRTLLWFHPGVWWLISRVQLAREEAVDELAMVVTGTRRGYVEALLAFADEPELVPVAAFTRRRHLLRRVRFISQESEMSIRRIVTSCVAATAVVAAAGWSAVKAFPITPTVIESYQSPQLQAATLGNEVPRRLAAIEPRFPSGVNPGLGGIVDVLITVDGSGNVDRPRVVHYTPIVVDPHDPSVTDKREMAAAQDAFSRAASVAVSDWKYTGGLPRPTPLLVSIGFAQDSATTVGEIRVSDSMTFDQLDATAAAVLPQETQINVSLAVLKDPDQALASDPPDWPSDAVRVGPGGVGIPKKVTEVAPVYPPAALEARMEGVVIVRLLIDREGHVAGTRTLRPMPPFDQAALDAVKQWQFEPTVDNGQPVPIIYNVAVRFRLPR